MVAVRRCRNCMTNVYWPSLLLSSVWDLVTAHTHRACVLSLCDKLLLNSVISKPVDTRDLLVMHCRYRCLGPGYLWIRFGKGFDGFTSTNAGLKRPVFLQSTWIRSRAVPNYPIRYQYVPDLIEQLTLCK